MMIRKSFFFISILALFLAACNAAPNSTPAAKGTPALSSTPAPAQPAAGGPTEAPGSGNLTVFAAASLTEAFTELGKAYEAEHPGVTITFNFAGSQQLAQQLAQGAPGDVFASADRAQMDAAIQASRVALENIQALAGNQLVIAAPLNNPAQIKDLSSLTQPGIKIVLAAPEVPAGKYAQQFLDKATKSGSYGANYKEEVLKNVVSYEENVRAVLSKVALGEADAGIVYRTDVTQALYSKVALLSIPDEFNIQVTYIIAPVSDSPHSGTAADFVAYTVSPAGQEILSRFGFLLIQ
jgi:molybdate transport system substrate-binding protein